MSQELGDKSWQLAFSDGACAPRRFTVCAGDTAALQQCIARMRTRLALADTAVVHSCYEAGRDGWWLHRWLCAQGIDNVVVEAASIELPRRARHAKTDRLDAEKLLAMLMRYHRGERRVWSVLHAPTLEQEDQRWLHREIERLGKERTAHTNRIGSLLVLHNLRARHIGGRDWQAWWAMHRAELPAGIAALIERECARLELVRQQLRELQAQQRRELAAGQQPQVQQLMQLRALGLKGAWVLCQELWSWREFTNRREVAACLGLCPTPYDSGGSRVEQGVSKSGSKRCRSLMVELAWMWLRLQPQSELAQWFQRRFGSGASRIKRVGIVALARKLAIALWRYMRNGEIPAGAQLKPAA
jgi:transposase